MERTADTGVEQRGPASDRALLRHEDRPDFVSATQHAGGSFVRFARAGEQVPGPDRAYGQPISSRLQRWLTSNKTGLALTHPDTKFMSRAISLARVALGSTKPQPGSGRGGGEGWPHSRRRIYAAAGPTPRGDRGARAGRWRRERSGALFHAGTLLPLRAHSAMYRCRHRGRDCAGVLWRYRPQPPGVGRRRCGAAGGGRQRGLCANAGNGRIV